VGAEAPGRSSFKDVEDRADGLEVQVKRLAFFAEADAEVAGSSTIMADAVSLDPTACKEKLFSLSELSAEGVGQLGHRYLH